MAKEKEKIVSGDLKLGNMTIDVAAFKAVEMTEKQFKSTFKGKLGMDMDKAWKELQKAIKKLK